MSRNRAYVMLYVLVMAAVVLGAMPASAATGDPWTDPPIGYEPAPAEARTSCVNVCPTIACPRTCPAEGENWEIRVEYHDGPSVGPATAGGCFGALSQVVCYQLTHIAPKGVTETLPASNPLCAPGLAECHRNIPSNRIKNTYGVRIR